MDYKVTIGIPVFNIGNYIRQMLDSVLGQTFPDIEFLICDDCGTDNSIDIVKEYQQAHPRGRDIRILHQPHNMGIGAGRNRMIAEAKGQYFYSIDGDDTIAPNTIELLYNAAEQYQAEIVYGSYERIFQEGDQTTRVIPFPYPLKVFTKPDEYACYVYNVGVQGMNWNYLIELDVLRRNHLQVTPVGHGYGEDFTFTIDLPTYITRAVLLPNITYQYYIRGVDKHHKKKVLHRHDMDLAIGAIDEKKRRQELRGKAYYPIRISKLLMIDCSFACEIVKRRDEFDEPYNDKEIRQIMWHPMSIFEILASHSMRKKNLLYYIIGIVPSSLSVLMLRLMAKRYGV